MNDKIREATRQWRAKAQNDWKTVEILTASKQCPADVVCFHCQQYVEKLLKGFLTLKGIEALRTHDLRRLIQLAESFEPKLAQLADEADDLTAHGVQTRYPGDFWQVEPAEMKRLVVLSQKFADILLPRLEQ